MLKVLGFSIVISVLAATLFAFRGPSLLVQGDRKMEDALADIVLLKRAVAEQERRIADLERIVKPSPPTIQARPSADDSSSQFGPDGAWKKVSSWSVLKIGMSESQVTAILGKPTSTETVGGTLGARTLFYRGEVSGSGFVSGKAYFFEGQLQLISQPVF